MHQFFPAKPLGCYGDGGAILTSDDVWAKKLKSLRLHGQSKRYHHQYLGIGGRLDTLQAAVLRVKLRHYHRDIALRQKVAETYHQLLSSKELIRPVVKAHCSSVWAQYALRVKNREALQEKLKNKGIPTAVQYPLAPAFTTLLCVFGL